MNDSENSFSEIINNHTVSYTDEGKYGAPVIIFIHGFPFNKSMWDPQLELLRDHCRIITYDIRGFGNSGTGNVDFTIGLFAEDLVSLMDVLKIGKAMLCGLSMGGYIALYAIEKYSDRFSALILSDTSCKSDTAEAKAKRLKAIENITKNGALEYAEQMIKNLFAPESFSGKVQEISSVKDMIANTSVKTLCDTLLALSNRKETCSKLSEIKIPVLIMAGREDIITPPAEAQYMSENITGSIVKIIDHSGHLSNLENTEEFNKQLKKFVLSVTE